jgi:two-component system cell cycle sensor histidine kinase/response regulator CckA
MTDPQKAQPTDRELEQIAGLNACFLEFTPNPDENIKKITAYVGKLLGGACALYNRLAGGLLCSIGQWAVPADYDPVDKPDGHICYDVIQRNDGNVFVVRDLQNTPYAETDPNVRKYNLETYIGIGVRVAECCVGSLCVVYRRDHYPTPADKQLLGIAASAIAVEEERKREKEKLRESEERYRQLVNLSPDAIAVHSGGVVKFVNDVGIELMGAQSAQDIVGKPTLSFVHPDYRDVVRNRMEVMMRDGTPVPLIEERLISIDGTPLDLEVAASPIQFQGEWAILVVMRDISNRRQTEHALRESEAKYRSALEQSMECIYLFDLETGAVLETNAALQNLLGYSNEEMLNLSVYDFVDHPKEDVDEKLDILRNRGCLILGERHYRCKDGDRIDVEVNATLLTYAGKHVGSVVSRDITERKRAHNALLESEEKFRTLAEQSPNMIFINSKGRVVYANRRCEEVMGYARDEFLAPDFDFFRLIAPESRERIRANFTLHRQGNNVEPFEYALVTKDGRRVGAIITTRLIDYDDDRAILGIVTDITERKQAEAALRQSEAKFRSLAENINVGIYRTTAGPTGRFIEANPAIIEMFGYSDRDEYLALSVADLYQNPADRKRFSEKILKEGFVRNEELRLKRKDGSSFMVSVSAVAVRDEEEGTTYFDGIIEDITERKKALEALRWSELQYRSTLDAMGDAIHVVDRDLKLLIFNKAFSRWSARLGLQTHVLGQHLQDVFPFLPEEIFSEYEEVFRCGEPLVTEERTTIAGQHFITETRKIPIREHDDVVRVVTVVRDVTASKLAEAALRESEERYRGLFDNATDFVFTLDLRGTFTNVNRAAKHHTGLVSEELIGLSFTKYIPIGERRRAIRAFRRLYETGEPLQDFPVDVIVSDGSRKHFEMSAGLLKRGEEIIGFQGSGRDVTERKQAHEALRRSEERFRELAEVLPEIVFEMDNDGVLTFVNKKAFEITDYGPEDLERGFNAIQLLVPEDRKRALTNIKKVMNGSEPMDNEYMAQRRDGSTFPLMARSVPIVSNGEIVGLRGILIDMTERERLEEQLRHAAKMEAIGQLAGGIAHDFNNLLTGILGYSNMLKLKSDPGSETHDAAKTIEGAAERAAELTDKLLGFARRGKRQIVSVDLHKTIYDVVSLLSRTVSKSIRISVHLDAKTANTLGDPGQLQQMLLNLAINARDAMPEGGDLTFTTQRRQLDADYCRTHPESTPGEYVAVEVSDTGCGIPKEIEGRIYEPFFTTKPTGQGTGMGLAMVYGIVKNHGGEIEVSSTLGHGTRFRVLLPRFEEHPDGTTEEMSHLPVGGVGTVLVVDDEEIVRMAVSDMLRRLGYGATAVSSGREAVEYYRRHGSEIDLVIIDLMMPDMDGSDCLMQLRSLDPRVRVLLSTGYGLDGKVQDVLDKGGRGFIQKPYQLKELDARVREALDAI